MPPSSTRSAIGFFTLRVVRLALRGATQGSGCMRERCITYWSGNRGASTRRYPIRRLFRRRSNWNAYRIRLRSLIVTLLSSAILDRHPHAAGIGSRPLPISIDEFSNLKIQVMQKLLA